MSRFPFLLFNILWSVFVQPRVQKFIKNPSIFTRIPGKKLRKGSLGVPRGPSGPPAAILSQQSQPGHHQNGTQEGTKDTPRDPQGRPRAPQGSSKPPKSTEIAPENVRNSQHDTEKHKNHEKTIFRINFLQNFNIFLLHILHEIHSDFSPTFSMKAA